MSRMILNLFLLFSITLSLGASATAAQVSGKALAAGSSSNPPSTGEKITASQPAPSPSPAIVAGGSDRRPSQRESATTNDGDVTSDVVTTEDDVISVYPTEIQLGSALDRQSIVVQRIRRDGITEDVTQSCIVRIEGPHAKFENNFVLPVSDLSLIHI